MNLSFKNKYNALLILLIIFTIISFFLGFYYDETATNGYVDLDWIKRNISIFLSNNILDSIKHPEYFGNRTPLMYILHVTLNPFIENIYYYRISVFLFSLLGPFFFYLCLKNKYFKDNKIILLLISSIILLSPYYRSSAYWGLEENYAIIFSLISLLSLEYFLQNNKIRVSYTYFLILVISVSSSACVYFDLKFLLIPLICFLSILFSEKNLKLKLLLFILYFTLAIPYLYLIFIWGGLTPPYTAKENINSITKISRISTLYYPHIGYAATIIGFYLFPLIFFMRKNFKKHFSDLLTSRINLFLIFIFILYLLYLFIFFDYEKFTTTNYWIGLGYIHKISILLFKDKLFIQEIFTLFSFLVCWIIILMFVNSNLINLLLIFYFFIISIFLWPLMQEYFDPIFLILSLLFFKNDLKINYKNSLILFVYFLIFFVGVSIYYFGPPAGTSYPIIQ
tara:strand:- start:643 stop:1998 length:1356 start_codon:yes stop_codon:yes gene_type:complete